MTVELTVQLFVWLNKGSLDAQDECGSPDQGGGRHAPGRSNAGLAARSPRRRRRLMRSVHPDLRQPLSVTTGSSLTPTSEGLSGRGSAQALKQFYRGILALASVFSSIGCAP